MAQTSTVTTALTLTLAGQDEAEYAARVVYFYEPHQRGVFERSGGQISPDDPAIVDIQSVTITPAAGLPLDVLALLNEAQVAALEAVCHSDAEALLDYEREAAAEYQAEDRRSRAEADDRDFTRDPE